MTTIYEVNQVLWVETPHGDGQALFLIDYGIHENTIWVVCLEKTREIKHYNSNQIKICWNHTLFKKTMKKDNKKKLVDIIDTTGQSNILNESPVDHPRHYNKGSIEVIDFIEDQEMNFNLGNVVKYVSRAGVKYPSKYVEDLSKALWYLEREISSAKKNPKINKRTSENIVWSFK